MSVMEIASWAATAIAVGGVVLNNHKRRECFVLWLVSNSVTLAIHAGLGVWGLAARDAAFFALAVHGFCKWGSTRNRESNHERHEGHEGHKERQCK